MLLRSRSSIVLHRGRVAELARFARTIARRADAPVHPVRNVGVAKLADALASGASAARRAGSSPASDISHGARELMGATPWGVRLSLLAHRFTSLPTELSSASPAELGSHQTCLFSLLSVIHIHYLAECENGPCARTLFRWTTPLSRGSPRYNPIKGPGSQASSTDSFLLSTLMRGRPGCNGVLESMII